MAIKDRAVINLRQSILSRRWLAVLLVLACAAPAAAQVTRPVWYPPLSLYGRPVAQPYFDFPTWARYSNCRPAPLAWGYDPFPNYGPCDGSADCVPSVACPGDFVAHRPRDWYASATFAPMTIDYPDGFPIARIGPSGPVVLSTEDLRPEFDAAGKFTIGRRIFDCYRLEGTYMGHYNWDDSLIVTNAGANGLGSQGNLSSFLSDFRDPINIGLDANDAVALSFRSSLESGEINLRYWADMPPGPLDVSYLVGARYFSLRENFGFLSTSPEPALGGGTTNNLDISTDNDLWGVQIGIEFACLVSTRWWVDVDLKGGIYNNDARQETTFISNGATSIITASGDRTAWVGDISILGNWQITPNFLFKVGYQALFVNGVALAQNQTVGPLFTNSPGALENSGDVFYHGPVIGIGWMR